MPRQPEGKLVRDIQAYLRSRGARPFKIQGGDESFQETGIPDLIVVFQGHFLGLEVKMPGNKPSAKQLHVLKSIEAAGGTAAVVESVAQVEEILDNLVSPQVAAWIAGFFDGEGTITLQKDRYPRMMVSQVDREPLLWMQQVLGMGRVVRLDRDGRTIHRWSISRRDDVLRFIEVVGPYIRLRHRRIKLEEAKDALSRTQSISSSRSNARRKRTP